MKIRLKILFTICILAWSGLAFCGEIHDAAKNGDLEKVRALLKANPDLANSKDDTGETPLHFATGKGSKEIVELLLTNKADVNVKDKAGETPLHYAAYGGKEVAEILLAHKADVNAKDDTGNTPLQLATMMDRKDVADLLRQHGGKE